ncbi:hypothetical protein F383_31219 [Gossypium arboreum]|uniref:Uncharacterized protein n=1 Tax=Gossypium arboreum TaxID=29729 RepID=A0A0B0PMQ8_GOSAR|nr:hypothetical protein F383_31219 [Gossypium arboreum]
MLRFFQIDTSVWAARVRNPGRVDFVRWPIFSVFGPFLIPFAFLCSPKYKT